MNDNKEIDNQLDALLKNMEPVVAPEGFTERVMEGLPVQKTQQMFNLYAFGVAMFFVFAFLMVLGYFSVTPETSISYNYLEYFSNIQFSAPSLPKLGLDKLPFSSSILVAGLLLIGVSVRMSVQE